MKLYKITWNERYTLSTVIEANSAEEAKETASFFTEGWLQDCGEQADVDVTIDDIEILFVEKLHDDVDI